MRLPLSCAIIAALALSLVPQSAALPQASDRLQSLRFIEGDWSGKQSKGEVRSNGEFSIKRDLARHILVRRDHVVYSERTGKAGSLEILVVMAALEDGKTFQANYFDSDGHVLNFTSSRVFPDSLIEFVSAPVADPMVFHLTYERSSGSGLRITFASSDVSKPDVLTTLVDGVAKRAGKRRTQ